jgi:putative intracellular protease/amidase
MIKPYTRRPPHRTVAFLTGDGKVLGEDGRRRRTGGGAVVYTDLDRCNALLTKGHGKALTWNAKPIRLVCDDYEAVVVQTGAIVNDDDVFMEGLVAWRDWVEDNGGGVASVGSTAWSLMRATLEHPFATNDGEVPPVRVLVGARVYQAVRSGTIRGELEHYDISAAYPRAMRGLTFGGGWRRIKSDLKHVEMWVRHGHPVFVHCVVRFSGSPPGPLPKRPLRARDPIEAMLLVTYDHEGQRQGTWSGPEVLAAAAYGADVKVLDVYVATGADTPFETFYDVSVEGRELPGFAGHLAKMTSNALWGQFAIGQGDKSYLSFADGRRRVERVKPMHGRPRDIPLAEYVVGTVRARLYRELLAPAGDQLIVAHTDGGWTRGEFSPEGEGWKHKATADVMDLIGPQSYAYTEPGHKRVTYVLAGTPPKHRQRAFREQWGASVPKRKPAVG